MKIRILFLSLVLSFGAKAQFIHTSGTQVLDKNDEKILLNGINLGNWLLWEGYLMMGDYEFRTHTQFFNSIKTVFNDDLGQAMEFEHQWRLNYVTENTIKEIKELGFNSVRVPFHYNLFWDWNTYSTTDRGFQYLDNLISYCHKYQIYIMLDLHAAPGYQNPGDHSDNSASNNTQPRETVQFWNSDYVAITAKIWKHIANKYKDEPIILGYDLLNEPVPQHGREYELLPSFVTIKNAIREVDTNHTIIVEGSWWGSDLQKLDWSDHEVQRQTGINTRWDHNLIYQTHHYSNDVAALNGRLALCNKLNIPLMLGEYGENSPEIIREMTDWCIEHEVHYFPWSFKKLFHDKTLWTINPTNEYKAIIDFIKNGGAKPANAFENMIAFCKNGLSESGNNTDFIDSFYNAIKLPDSLITRIDNESQSLKVYPNPVTTELHLTTNTEWIIYTPIGFKIQEGIGNIIQVEHLQTGVYYLSIENEVYSFLKE